MASSCLLRREHAVQLCRRSAVAVGAPGRSRRLGHSAQWQRALQPPPLHVGGDGRRGRPIRTRSVGAHKPSSESRPSSRLATAACSAASTLPSSPAATPSPPSLPSDPTTSAVAAVEGATAAATAAAAARRLEGPSVSVRARSTASSTPRQTLVRPT